MRVFKSVAPLAWKCWERIYDRTLMKKFGVKGRKYAREMSFWEGRWEAENRDLCNSHYKDLFLAMADQPDGSFCRGKIVADFGCGPRGSLHWLKEARVRIGIDVLADNYSRFNISAHDMCYVVSTETRIPLPSDYADVLFTLNALDHVSRLRPICDELRRVLAPEGLLIGSFNLDEPATACEPQTLTEETLSRCLWDDLVVESYRLGSRAAEGGLHGYYVGEEKPRQPTGRVLWVRARKKK